MCNGAFIKLFLLQHQIRGTHTRICEAVSLVCGSRSEADVPRQTYGCGPSTDAFSARPPAVTAECWQLARARAFCVGTATLLQSDARNSGDSAESGSSGSPPSFGRVGGSLLMSHEGSTHSVPRVSCFPAWCPGVPFPLRSEKPRRPHFSNRGR